MSKLEYDRAEAITAIQAIQSSAEQAIQEAFRQKTFEKMLQVFEAGVRKGIELERARREMNRD